MPKTHLRNLSAYELGKQALIFKPLFEQQAKERQGTRTDIVHNSAQCNEGRTRDKIAEIAQCPARA